MAIPIQFTIVYDWLAKRKDLTWPEKMIIAHILRFSKNGCFKSYGKIAVDLGMDRVSVIRATKRLIDSQWVVPVYPKRRERILFINQEMLDDMPLLAGVKGCGKPVSKPVSFEFKGSGAAPPGSGAAPPSGSGAAPLPLNRNRRKSLLEESREKRLVEREVDFLSSVLRERGKPTEMDFESRRRQLHNQIEQLKGEIGCTNGNTR